jgi:hypothetical protein
MVLVEVSPGELADKVSILNIKLENITDEKKREHIQNELWVLSPHVKEPIDELYTVNKVLWDVENEIRLCEKNGDFGSNFVRLARLVYQTNDRRAEIKREINAHSTIAEEKQYTEYASKNRPRLVVMTHMGLGDHIVCNGMIRHFAETYDVITYAKHHYFKSVEYMFRDLGSRVTVVSTEGDQDAWTRSLQEKNVVRTGIFCGPSWECTKPWCNAFYINAGLDPKLLRDNFFMLRSRDREEAFYRKVIAHIGTDKYIVVHDDPSRYEPITVQTDLPVVRIGRGLFPIESDSLFDYCMLIERAQEYHGFDSSFAWIVELFRFRPKKTTFLHRYIRTYCSPGYEEFTQFEIISKGLSP